MFCSNCGREIADAAVICPHCGAATDKPAPAEQKNTLAIVGFILSFFVPLVGLILSIIGLRKSAKLNGSGKKLAIAGIIISAGMIVFEIIFYFVLRPALMKYIYALLFILYLFF